MDASSEVLLAADESQQAGCPQSAGWFKVSGSGCRVPSFSSEFGFSYTCRDRQTDTERERERVRERERERARMKKRERERERMRMRIVRKHAAA